MILNKKYCNYYLKKNGKVKYLPYEFNKYLCITKKIINSDFIRFPYIYSKNEDEFIKKLLILEYSKKFNLKYFIISKNLIFIFNDDIKGNKDYAINILFLKYITNKNKDAEKFFYGNIKKLLITSFMINKLIKQSISNDKLLINIFFEIFIKEIKYELIEKYNKNMNDFANFNELYLFLKKTGYVDIYYNKYANNMIKNYKKFYKKLISFKELTKFKLKKSKEIKNFKDIDLMKIINNIANNYAPNKFNKTYIKNKFIEIVEKYNI